MAVRIQSNSTTSTLVHNNQDSFSFNQNGIVSGISCKFPEISATTSSNALTVTLQPTAITFRSATLSSGSITQIQSAVPISLTIPAGATLGTTSGNPAELYLLALNNSGTIELAVVNSAGGIDLNEMNLLSTAAISSSSNSASVVYSHASRTSVPYRIVGVIRLTQTTAGQWATAPSLVHGINSLVNYTLQNQTAPASTDKTWYQYFGNSFASYVADLGGWSMKKKTEMSDLTSNILSKLTAAVSKNSVKSAEDKIAIFGGTYPGGGFSAGAVLLPDGRVFCIPFNSTTARIYNPLTGAVTTPGGTYPGSGAFVGGVLLPDGRVFCVPHNSTTARIYNPISNTLIILSGTYPGTYAFFGGVLLPDGRVFCVPFNSTTARIYNPTTDTVTTPSVSFPGSGAFAGGVLLPDGRVFLVPHNSTTALIYDPVSNTTVTPSGTYPGSSAFVGGVLLPDGRVFLVPHNSATARIYDPISNTTITPSGTYPVGGAFNGGVLLPDGRVFCVPYNSTTSRIYDPVSDLLTTPSGSYAGTYIFFGGVLLPDGRVFCAPHNSTTGLGLAGAWCNGPNFPPNVLLGPWFSKY